MSERYFILALILCVTSASGCAYSPLARYEKSLLYQPSKDDVGHWHPPPSIGFEDAQFAAADGTKLHGWFLDHPQRRAVVLFTHGNGGNVATWAPSLKYLVDRHRVAAMVFDYRGYGKSAGEPDERGILQDARAARKWLAERANVHESDIVLMGQSLGGAVAVDLAAKDGARGLVLVSTFTSAPDVAAHHLPWLPARTLMTQRFTSLAKIKQYHGPLLVCHGDADRVIPFQQGEDLFLACPSEQKQFIRHTLGDHNDPPPEEYRLALDAFLEQRLSPQQQLTGPRRGPGHVLLSAPVTKPASWMHSVVTTVSDSSDLLPGKREFREPPSADEQRSHAPSDYGSAIPN